MALDLSSLPPQKAWSPLDPKEWSADHARHLLRRMGFAATPDRVTRAVEAGLDKTLDEAFGKIRPLPPPATVTQYIERRESTVVALRQARLQGQSEEEVRMMQNELRRDGREAFMDGTNQWLQFARQPDNSAQENLVLFLSDIFVVAFSKVQEPDRLFAHVNLLRQSWQKPYPDIVEAVTFSPGMIEYLDLQTSRAGVPNENYARELMELFTLGEGNYTETDVKEAARALTGITIRYAEGQHNVQRWDRGQKTIFGRTGAHRPRDVVNLIFQQRAARTFLPKEALRWYVAEEPLPAAHVAELGELYVRRNWRVSDLVRTILASRLFYAPPFRGNLIKSPIRYYLGLCQDLNLDVLAVQGPLTQSFRAMGQEPFNAPNVRGWVGGRHWINSSTLAARRQLVQQLFAAPAERARLNADQQVMVQNAEQAGRGAGTVTAERLQNLASLSNAELAEHLLKYFLPGQPDEAYRQALVTYLQTTVAPREQLVREVTTALLQSPLYQLC